MSLRDIVRSGVAIADSITQPLQVGVLHYRYADATKDDSGHITWGIPLKEKCVVEQKKTQQRNKDERDAVNYTLLTFPRPTLISVFDKFVLPDGTSGTPISRVGSVVDPITSAEYIKEVIIGSSRIR